MNKITTINTDKKSVKFSRVIYYFWMHIKNYPFYILGLLTFLIIGNILSAYAPIYLKKIIDLISQTPSNEGLVLGLKFFTLYIILRIVKVISDRTTYLFDSYFTAHTVRDARAYVSDKLLSQDYEFFTNHFTGSLTGKIGKYKTALQDMSDRINRELLPLLVWIISSFYIVYSYSHRIAFGMVIGLVLFIVFNILAVRYKARFDRMSAEAETNINSNTADMIGNYFTINIFNGYRYENTRLYKLLDNYKFLKIQQWKRGELIYGVQTLIIIGIEYYILKYSLMGWMNGTITAGTVALFQIYIFNLMNRLFFLTYSIRRIGEDLSDASEMVEILDRVKDVEDKKDAIDAKIENGDIIFENIDFSYKNGNSILDNFNLRIKSGEKVGLVGVSGAGKSTIFKLLLRLHNANKGNIIIDGYNINDITQHSLHEAIAYVPQESVLFHRSLAENIGYGNKNATIEDIKRVSKDSQSIEFIEKTMHGFDTLVGERGIKLSGGERQRIAIARAMIKNAPILLLDEATSALDSHGESKIQQALEKLMTNKTVIAIAHRLSTIKKMDRILVMSDGIIIEEGSHEELLKKKDGAYKKLWDMQVDGFIG